MRSQTRDVENYLKTHKNGITSMEAIEKFGATRLADIIYRLRRKGCKIAYEDVKTKNRYGHTTTYRRYVLR